MYNIWCNAVACTTRKPWSPIYFSPKAKQTVVCLLCMLASRCKQTLVCLHSTGQHGCRKATPACITD